MKSGSSNPAAPYRKLVAGVVALVAVVASACATGSADPDDAAATDSTESSEAPEQHDPIPVEFVLNWTTSLSEWSGIIAALELGYYEEAGLDVSVLRVAGSVEAVSTLGAGQGDLGFAAAESVLGGISEGMPLTAVAAALQTNPIGVIAPADSEIESVDDLAGKKISTAHAGPEPAILEALLPSDGQVELVYVDPQAKCTLTLRGQTDACTGTAAFQPIQLADAGLDARMIPFSTAENPIVGPVIVARNDFLAEQPNLVEAFLEATYRGYAEAVKDRERTLDLYESHFAEFDRDFMSKGLEITEEFLFSDVSDQSGWGWMVKEQWSGLHDSLLKAEVIANAVDTDSAFTTEFLTGARDWTPAMAEN